MKNTNKSSSNAVFDIKPPIVLVTKYRRKTQALELLEYLETAFAEHLTPFYRKPLFWHRAYFVGSVGGATLETVRAYVDAQGTEEQARKAKKLNQKPNRPLDPLLAQG